MLYNLSIRNFILIEELDLEFQSGLCVITGETGAGKSILLKALLFCLNGKLIDNVIRHGTDSCTVIATFALSKNIKEILLQLQIESENELVIRRSQTSDNRKKFLINDQVVTAKTVTMIADLLFELHGQNTHTALLKSSSHLDHLDDYGNLTDLRKTLVSEYNKLHNIKSQLKEISDQQQETLREIEYLQFITDELSTINVKIDEEEHLADLRRNLQNRDKELQLFHDLLLQLEAPELSQAINRANRIISRINQADQRFVNIRQQLEEADNNLAEAKQQLQDIIANLATDEHNLDTIEERLFIIKGLVRKYGVSSANQLPDFLVSTKLKLLELQQKIANSSNLHQQLKALESEYLDLAKILSEKRITVALALEASIQQELALLQMEKVLFKVERTIKPVADVTGIDEVRFTASTNPGMPYTAIDKIASGGELSRFMLALKSTLVANEAIPLVIFDEIDTGVSGTVADSIGNRLKQLARISQVIVITHQPQVAAKADQHLLVSKMHFNEQTRVIARILTKSERVQVLAQMIAGKTITENSVKAAQDLLAY
ncbi:DNA repair protein RecN [Candidatus Trichorickettsia mobilis]|uniref:DNA repair protein RecN n=1 Tax=Candidatus Trichorickettsia mobilis TaxID=1346319 RepID=A0ABZ0UT91_9RICK|nr:DNA repair protein RecN [Candidatus Trichorickettsia mobilis]WPY00868.1 DNA repair protein RecN [Candidatus Trichorickettsia mobilis]